MYNHMTHITVKQLLMSKMCNLAYVTSLVGCY